LIEGLEIKSVGVNVLTRLEELLPMISFTLFLSLLIAGLLEVILPVVLAVVLWRRFKVKWIPFVMGVVCWFVAYIIRSPINTYGSVWIYNNLTGGALLYMSYAFPCLTAGLFEEGARWVAFRFFVKDHRLENGLMYGAGHGGIESILLVGVSVLSTAISAYMYPQMYTTAQLAAIAATPEWVAFIALWERIATITFHVAMSVLVLESFKPGQGYYLGVAMGAHFFLNFTALYALQYGIVASEAVVTVWGAVGLYYLWTTWKSYKAATAAPPVEAPATPATPTPA